MSVALGRNEFREETVRVSTIPLEFVVSDIISTSLKNAVHL